MSSSQKLSPIVAVAAAAIGSALCVAGCGNATSRSTFPTNGGGGVLVVSLPNPANGQQSATEIRSTPGVVAATPVLKTMAYLGPKLEPIYGVDPVTFAAAAEMRDFRSVPHIDGLSKSPLTTDAVATALRTHKDAVYLTTRDLHNYLLKAGDVVRLRLRNRRQRLTVTAFRVAGVSGTFAGTSEPEIMLANIAYVEHAVGAHGPDMFLVKFIGDAHQAAARLLTATSGAHAGVTIAAPGR